MIKSSMETLAYTCWIHGDILGTGNTVKLPTALLDPLSNTYLIKAISSIGSQYFSVMRWTRRKRKLM